MPDPESRVFSETNWHGPSTMHRKTSNMAKPSWRAKVKTGSRDPSEHGSRDPYVPSATSTNKAARVHQPEAERRAMEVVWGRLLTPCNLGSFSKRLTESQVLNLDFPEKPHSKTKTTALNHRARLLIMPSRAHKWQALSPTLHLSGLV